MAFKWINAGCGYQRFGDVSIYVRFRNKKQDYSEKSYYNGIFVKLQDRDLFITRPGFVDYNNHIPLPKYDYAVNCDILSGDTAVKHEGIMFAYEPRESKRDFRYDKRRASVPLYGDSGGFQLVTGVEDFIDPIDLAYWANNHVNKLMTIDIPIIREATEKIFKKTAKLQKRNTKLLKSHLDDDVELYNIVHGKTTKQRREFVDTVYRDDLKKWALGGVYGGSISTMIRSIYSVIDYVPAESYHIFGIANTKLIPLLAWIGKFHDITSDSSTPLQNGISSFILTLFRNRIYKSPTGKRPNELVTDAIKPMYSNNVFPIMPCSCNICSAVGNYEITINSGYSVLGHTICTLHNITAMYHFAKLWSELAIENSTSKYLEILKSYYGKKEYPTYRDAIRHINNIEEHGLEKAERMGAMSIFPVKKDIDANLFGKSENKEEDRVQKIRNRLHNILHRYKLYYSDGDALKENLKESRKKKLEERAKDPSGKDPAKTMLGVQSTVTAKKKPTKKKTKK